MRSVKPPAFQFYATDWNGSSAVTMMTARQCGFYINLMARAWDSSPIGTLPNDPDLLWRMARASSKKEFDAESDLVLKQFKVLRGGKRIAHPRLLSERLKQISFAAQCSLAGRISGQKRLENKKNVSTNKNKEIDVNDRSTTVQRPLNRRATETPTETQPEGNRKATLLSSSSIFNLQSSSLKKESLAHAVVLEVPEPQTAGASPSPSEVKKAIGKAAQQLHPRNGTSTGLRAHIEAGIYRKKIEAAYFDATQAGIPPGQCIQEAVKESALSLMSNRSVELKGLTHGELAIAAWAKISANKEAIEAVKSFEIRSKQVVAVSVRCVVEAAMEFLAKEKDA